MERTITSAWRSGQLSSFEVVFKTDVVNLARGEILARVLLLCGFDVGITGAADKGASLSERTRLSQIVVLAVRSKPRRLKTATGCTALKPVHIRDFADGFDFAELRGFDRGGILCSLK
jgi:hypothetical protein